MIDYDSQKQMREAVLALSPAERSVLASDGRFCKKSVKGCYCFTGGAPLEDMCNVCGPARVGTNDDYDFCVCAASSDWTNSGVTVKGPGYTAQSFRLGGKQK